MLQHAHRDEMARCCSSSERHCHSSFGLCSETCEDLAAQRTRAQIQMVHAAARYSAVLEQALSTQYTTLTKGTTIAIAHHGAEYCLDVVELEPEDACLIIDTDMEVEVRPPVDEDGNMLPLPAIEGSLPTAVAQAVVQDLVEFMPPVQLGRDFVFLRVPVQPGQPFLFRAQNAPGAAGDLEAYMSPGASARPTASDHHWTNNLGEYMQEAQIYVPGESIQDPVMVVGMRAYDSKSTMVLCSALRGEEAEAERARYLPRTNAARSAAADVVPEGKRRCPNCGENVPQQSFLMHSAYCERNNYHCELCGKAVLKKLKDKHWHCPVCTDYPFVSASEAAIAKHQNIFHQPVACEDCGVQLDLAELVLHRRSECPHRWVTCRFCFNSVRAGEPARDHGDRLRGMTQHESECGSKTDKCSRCDRLVRLKDMEMHLRLHDMDACAPKPVLAASQPVAVPAVSDEARARAWARAGFALPTDDFSRTPSPPTQAPVPVAMSAPAVRTSPVQAADDIGTPTSELCANTQCIARSAGVKSRAGTGLCQSCFEQIWPNSSERPETASLLKGFIGRYFQQLTKGCARGDCNNPQCARSAASSGTLPKSQSETLAQCVALSKEALSGPSSSLCVPAEVRPCSRKEHRALCSLISLLQYRCYRCKSKRLPCTI
eukprot:m.246555 g.246555  ORF g.246555 m.246555 type:complete len:659 (-) comp10968_c3_seq8:206-2182(-)